MNRNYAARNMFKSFRKFDEIMHAYRVTVNGMIFYDRVLLYRHIDVSHAA
jgi:hypothetical protein